MLYVWGRETKLHIPMSKKGRRVVKAHLTYSNTAMSERADALSRMTGHGRAHSTGCCLSNKHAPRKQRRPDLAMNHDLVQVPNSAKLLRHPSPDPVHATLWPPPSCRWPAGWPAPARAPRPAPKRYVSTVVITTPCETTFTHRQLRPCFLDPMQAHSIPGRAAG